MGWATRMESHRLRFAEIIILNKNLAEVIIDEAIEMDLSMVEEYHAFLLSHLDSSFSLLINKRHAYGYTFDAQ